MADVQISDLGGVIKTAYEDEADTNAFTDALLAKLNGVEAGATADPSDAEIEAAYNARVPAASQAEAEAGTGTAILRWSPLRVAQAIAALASGSGGSGALAAKDTIDDADLIDDEIITLAKIGAAAILGDGSKLVTADTAGSDGQLAAFDNTGKLQGGPTPATASGIAAKAAPVAGDRHLIFDSEAGYGFKYVAHSVLQTVALAWVAAAKYLKSDPTGISGAGQVTNVVSLTSAEYGAITPAAATVYLITDAT